MAGPVPGSALALGLSYSNFAVRDFVLVSEGTDSPRGVPIAVTDTLGSTGGINDLRAGVPNIQNVITYTVGFKLGTDALSNSGRSLMGETAQRGGGKFYEAADAQQLEDVLTAIFRQVLTSNTSFSAMAPAMEP